ncbi:MAG: macro domain-containing protein [Proteobacteria bacterium]|nr:macro domain-containing protein [Pseudomonadota bacterium]
MIQVAVGDILKSKASTLVNTVNCVGIMGKGIAAEFKKLFPEMFEDYVKRCERHEIKPGVPYLFKASLFPPQIINFPTKSHWRAASRIEDIEKGLKIFVSKYREWGVKSIAMPPLGCGNGQLLWETVGPLMFKYLSKLDIPVELYAPYGTPPAQLTEKFLSREINLGGSNSGESILQKINPAWAALIEIVYRIEKQKYHMPVGRTIFQKIAYVATVLGLPTGLEHVRGSYGPYCQALDDVKKRLSNAGLLQEEKSGSMFQVIPGLAYENFREKHRDDLNKWDNLIDKTVDLFLRLNTEKAEIVATVLFTERTTNKGSMTEKDVLQAVMKWKQKRRPPISEAEVAETIRNLGMLKWFQLTPSVDLPIQDEWVQ